MGRRKRARKDPLGGPLRTATDLAVSNKASFQGEAASQLACAVCGKSGDWDPHHVIYEQHLSVEGRPLFDTRNALRVCSRWGGDQCHAKHHSGERKIKTKELKDDNVAYAFHTLGARAIDYLRRYYDDSDPDPRLERHLAAVV